MVKHENNSPSGARNFFIFLLDSATMLILQLHILHFSTAHLEFTTAQSVINCTLIHALVQVLTIMSPHILSTSQPYIGGPKSRQSIFSQSIIVRHLARSNCSLFGCSHSRPVSIAAVLLLLS